MPEMNRRLSGSKDESVQDAGMKHSIFLSNLEQWIDEVISRDGLADKEIIERIRDSFGRAMQANIEYHRLMAKNAVDNRADRHKLMAEIYQELLPLDGALRFRT